MIKNILFDLDGTLADTALDLSNALNAVRLSYKLPKLPIDTIRPTVSQGASMMIKVGFDVEVGDPKFDEIHKKFLEIYSENIAEETKLFEGMDAVLEKIDNNKPITSINLFIKKLDTFLYILFISIIMNQINHFVSFNNYC